MPGGKRFGLVKILKLIVLVVFVLWIHYKIKIFINSYSVVRNYSSSFNGINMLSKNNTEIGEEIYRTNKFQIEFRDLNISYVIFHSKKLECNGTKLLIVIPSRPNAFHTRVAIRNSWLRNVPSGVTYRFIIGSTQNVSIRKLIKKEFEQYQDLIATNIRDSYANLPLKINAILQWQQKYCPKTEYLLKTDDDTVVDIKRLMYWIRNSYKYIAKQFNNKVLFGKVWSKTIPKRNPQQKWYTSYLAWNQSFYPDYCNGPTYLLTSKAAELILEQTSNFYLITIEDVLFTGILADAAGIKRIDRWKNFGSTVENENECDDKNVPFLISIYGIESKKMIYEEEKINSFSTATKKLLALTCQ